MSYILDPSRPIRRELKKAARRQLRRADVSLRHDGERAVHEARKSVKKVRAILTLMQQADTKALGRHERKLRAVGRALSALRDAEMTIGTFDQLCRRFPMRLPEHTNAMVRRRLVRTRTQVLEDARRTKALRKAADRLREVRRAVKGWRVPAIDVPDLPDLLKASYGASRKAMRKARRTSDPADLHRWRKRVKTLWYELRLTQTLAPDLRAMIQSFDQLETRLGDSHNVWVLQATIEADDDLRRRAPAAVRELIEMCGKAQSIARRKALPLGRRLLAGRPNAFARQLRRLFSAARRTPESGRRKPASAAA